MNIFRLIFAALMLVTVSLSVVAQQRPATAAPTPAPPQRTTRSSVPDMKIALINTSVFSDDKEGIIRLRDALKSLDREFEPRHTEIKSLQTRMKAIAEELNKLRQASVVAPETLNAKQEEGERMERELKWKGEQGQKDFEQRYSEVADPISKDIGNALDRFAEQRGITLTLDISKFIPAILTMHPALDLTKEFIADYNSKNPGTAATPRQ